MAYDKPKIVPDLAPRLRGLYIRVARKMRLDPEYVAGVALGRCRSQAVEAALEQELRRILAGAAGREFLIVSRDAPKGADAEDLVASNAGE